MIMGLLFGRSRLVYFGIYAACGLALAFLILPLLVIIPLSFNQEPYFTFPIASYSLRWYEALAQSDQWHLAAVNSIIVALGSTALSTVLGTLAALGLARSGFPFRSFFQTMLVLPMVVPIIVTAVSLYFLYSRIGLTGSLTGLIIAHATVAVPFVVVTVGGALASFDFTLVRAGNSLGATPWRCFWKITFPLILPGIVSGMIFAFITSFDDVVIALFISNAPQWTLPRQMWSGLRENVDPTILAAAVLLTITTISLQLGLELIKRNRKWAA